MSPELMMWFVLATKMAVTALFVTAATIIAERLGATVGALVATLPVSGRPVYVFLALDHDSTFISSSAVASLALNSATAIYLTAYVLITQRRSMWLSISLAFVMWLAAVLVLSPVQWAAWSASALNVVLFTACTLIELRAVTGPDYGRIFDHELVAAVQRIAGNGTGDTRWKIPGVLDWSTGIYNPCVDVTKNTTTLYASDRDVFLFLVDELYSTDHHNVADGLTTLPRDYAGIPRDVPRLGPPLPGDLGHPIVTAEGQSGPIGLDAEQQRANQETESARTSKVFPSTTAAVTPQHAASQETPPD